MQISFSKSFIKTFDNMRENEKARIAECIELFSRDPFNPKLRNHRLTGKYSDYRSISAGGDIRIHYKEIKHESEDENEIIFAALGTHSRLY